MVEIRSAPIPCATSASFTLLARRAPSPRLYSMVPRLSQCPSSSTFARGLRRSQSALAAPRVAAPRSGAPLALAEARALARPVPPRPAPALGAPEPRPGPPEPLSPDPRAPAFTAETGALLLGRARTGQHHREHG